MSRSSPGTPLFLGPAWHAIKKIIDEAEGPITDEQIRDKLIEQGFEWPQRFTLSSYQRDSPKVTLAKVRRLTVRIWGYGVERDRETGGWVSTL